MIRAIYSNPFPNLTFSNFSTTTSQEIVNYYFSIISSNLLSFPKDPKSLSSLELPLLSSFQFKNKEEKIKQSLFPIKYSSFPKNPIPKYFRLSITIQKNK